MAYSRKYRNLVKNTLLFTINAISSKFIAFFLLPLYTSYMSAGEYGVADMSRTVISLVTPLVTLSIADAVLRFMIEDDEGRNRYASVGFVVTMLSVFLVWMLTPLLCLNVFGGLGNYSGWFVAAYASSALLQYCGNVARGINNVKAIPICATVSSLATFVLAFVLLRRLEAMEAYFISMSVGPLIGIVAYLLLSDVGKAIASGVKELISIASDCSQIWSQLGIMLKYSFPLIPNSLFWWMATSINRFFLTSMLGISFSGLYAAASTIPTLINSAYGIFQQAWQLSAFQENKQRDISRFYENVFSLVQAGMMVLCGMISLFSPILGSIMLKGDTYESWPMIGLLVLANLMNVFNMFYGTIYTSTMQTSFIMTTTIYGALTCIILTPLLIIILGVNGACLASVIGQALVFGIRAKKSRSLIVFNPKWGYLTPSLVALSIQSVFIGFQLNGWSLVSLLCFGVVLALQLHNLFQLKKQMTLNRSS